MSLPDGSVYAETLKTGDMVIDPHTDAKLTVRSVRRVNATHVEVISVGQRSRRWHKFLGVHVLHSA